MADIIDKANDTAEFLHTVSLKNKAKPGPQPTGRCLNCEEPLPFPERWCDNECREDWEKEQRANSHARIDD